MPAGICTLLLLALLAACAAADDPAPTPCLDRRSGDLESFSPAAFRAPDSFFHPSVMWIWNDVLTADRLREQLTDMASHGALGAMPVPEPKEFRPTWMPTRLEPDYLSTAFMEIVRQAVDEARRRGMRFWLYDEGGWPSGSVCGRLVRENPDLARQVLEHVEEKPSAGSVVTVPADALAGFLYRAEERIARVPPGGSARVENVGARWLVFRARRGGSYPDLLNPRATDAFLRMTHEAYARVVGKEFGRTIPAIFTDEPQASAMPWTGDLADDFRRTYGYDLLDRLPSLFEGEADADRRARIDYHDWWSRRFADAYLGRIQAWCSAQGLLSTGHLNGEDETLGAIKHGYGNLMRCMRRLDIPGIDVIWRQLWPGQANSDFPRHASSVIHQEGRRWAITESFAVYGSGLTPEQMKWIVDYQFARGINLINMVGYPYSTSDWLAGGERPHFHALDPLWRWMPLFHGYVARMSYLLSLGRPATETALYFPIRDIWAGGEHARQTAAAFDRLARALLENGGEYDLVDDDVLGREGTYVEDGALCIGPMRYRTVVVPPCAWMPPASRDRLSALASAGGAVLAVDSPEGAEAPAGWRRVAEADLPARVAPLVRTDTPAPWLRAMKRRLRNGSLYLLTNEGTGPLRCRASFTEKARPVLLDPATGAVRRVQAARRDGEWEMDLDLPFAGSAVLLFPAGSQRAGADPGVPGRVLQEIGEGWTLRTETAFEIGETGLSRADAADAPSRPVSPGDWRPVLGESYTGTAVYEATFTCSAEEARAAAWLDLGTVRHAAEVEINGESLGARAWQPWAWPVSGRMRAGRNTLRVRVGNTMANQYVHTKALQRWKPEQLGPYHPTALRFEPESLPSGLFGPVTLRAAR